MDILGVGPLELLFILLIALIVLGPGDMVKAGRTIGSFLRKVVTSPTWRLVQQTSRDLRNLPNTLIREAGLEEEAKRMQDSLNIKDLEKDIQKELDGLKDIEKETQADLSDWTTPPDPDQSPTKSQTNEVIEDQAIVETSGEDNPVIDPRSVGSPEEITPIDDITDADETIEEQGES